MAKKAVTFLVLTLLAVLVACTTMKYQADTSFLVSAQADSPEFPIFLNGKVCKDTDGIPGMCSKRIKSNEHLVLSIDPRPYSYTLKLACSPELGIDQSIPVQKGAPLSFDLGPEALARVVSFVCRGRVVPDDREEPVAGLWQFMVTIVDKNYQPREVAYIAKQGKASYLILGQHAKYARVYDKGWKEYSEQPLIEIKGDPAKVMAYSESHMMRFNSVGL